MRPVSMRVPRRVRIEAWQAFGNTVLVPRAGALVVVVPQRAVAVTDE